jgi:hypothetical protein
VSEKICLLLLFLFSIIIGIFLELSEALEFTEGEEEEENEEPELIRPEALERFIK